MHDKFYEQASRYLKAYASKKRAIIAQRKVLDKNLSANEIQKRDAHHKLGFFWGVEPNSDVNKAIEHFKHSYELSEEYGQDEEDWYEDLMHIGTCYQHLGNWKEARMYFDKHLLLAQQADNDEQIVKAGRSLGLFYAAWSEIDLPPEESQQKFNQCVRSNQLCLEVLRTRSVDMKSKKQQESEILLNLGNAYLSKDPVLALKYHKMALAAAEASETVDSILDTAHTLALTYAHLRCFKQGLKVLSERFSLVSQSKNRYQQEAFYHQLEGDLMFSLGLIEEATEKFQISSLIYQKHRKFITVSALDNTENLEKCATARSYEQKVISLQESARTAELEANVSLQVSLLVESAQYCLAFNSYEAAKKICAHVLSLDWPRSDMWRWHARVLRAAALASLGLLDCSGALSQTLEARKILEEHSHTLGVIRNLCFTATVLSTQFQQYSLVLAGEQAAADAVPEVRVEDVALVFSQALALARSLKKKNKQKAAVARVLRDWRERWVVYATMPAEAVHMLASLSSDVSDIGSSSEDAQEESSGEENPTDSLGENEICEPNSDHEPAPMQSSDDIEASPLGCTRKRRLVVDDDDDDDEEEEEDATQSGRLASVDTNSEWTEFRENNGKDTEAASVSANDGRPPPSQPLPHTDTAIRNGGSSDADLLCSSNLRAKPTSLPKPPHKKRNVSHSQADARDKLQDNGSSSESVGSDFDSTDLDTAQTSDVDICVNTNDFAKFRRKSKLRDVLTYSDVLGTSYQAEGLYDSALRYFKYHLRLTQRHEDLHRRQGESWLRIGRCLGEMGKNEDDDRSALKIIMKAINILGKAVALSKQFGDSESFFYSHLALADLYLSTDRCESDKAALAVNLAESLDHCNKAVSAALGLHSDADECKCQAYNARGNTLTAMSDRQLEAVESYERAASVATSRGWKAITFHNLGTLLGQLDRDSDCTSFLKRALAATENQHQKLELYYELARISFKNSRPDAAGASKYAIQHVKLYHELKKDPEFFADKHQFLICRCFAKIARYQARLAEDVDDDDSKARWLSNLCCEFKRLMKYMAYFNVEYPQRLIHLGEYSNRRLWQAQGHADLSVVFSLDGNPDRDMQKSENHLRQALQFRHAAEPTGDHALVGPDLAKLLERSDESIELLRNVVKDCRKFNSHSVCKHVRDCEQVALRLLRWYSASDSSLEVGACQSQLDNQLDTTSSAESADEASADGSDASQASAEEEVAMSPPQSPSAPERPTPKDTRASPRAQPRPKPRASVSNTSCGQGSRADTSRSRVYGVDSSRPTLGAPHRRQLQATDTPSVSRYLSERSERVHTVSTSGQGRRRVIDDSDSDSVDTAEPSAFVREFGVHRNHHGARGARAHGEVHGRRRQGDGGGGRKQQRRRRQHQPSVPRPRVLGLNPHAVVVGSMPTHIPVSRHGDQYEPSGSAQRPSCPRCFNRIKLVKHAERARVSESYLEGFVCTKCNGKHTGKSWCCLDCSYDVCEKCFADCFPAGSLQDVPRKVRRLMSLKTSATRNSTQMTFQDYDVSEIEEPSPMIGSILAGNPPTTTSRARVTETPTPAAPPSVEIRVTVLGELFLIVLPSDPRTVLDVRWLMDEATSRYRDFSGKQPIIVNLRVQENGGDAGAALLPTDLLASVNIAHRVVSAEVRKDSNGHVEWVALPLCEQYLANCRRENTTPAEGVTKALSDSSASERDALSFDGLGITDVHLRMCVSTFSSIKNLKTLELGSNRIADEGMQCMVSLFPSLPHLEVLVLTCNMFTGLGLKRVLPSLAKNCVDLKVLHLGFNELGDSGAEAVREFLCASERTSPLELDLSNCSLESLTALLSLGIGLRATASKNRADGGRRVDAMVHILRLAGNFFGTDGLRDLVGDRLPVSLKYLDISSTGLDSGAAEILGLINDTSSMGLDANFNHIGDTPPSSATVVRSNPTLLLTKLSLRAVGLGAKAARAMRALLQSSSLQHLILSDNRLGPEGASFLADALPGPSLRLLDLSGCSLEATGVIAVLNALCCDPRDGQQAPGDASLALLIGHNVKGSSVDQLIDQFFRVIPLLRILCMLDVSGNNLLPDQVSHASQLWSTAFGSRAHSITQTAFSQTQFSRSLQYTAWE